MSAYYENSSSTTEVEDYTGYYHWAPAITIGEAGNVTKLEVWTRAASGNIRMGLYNAATRQRLDSGTNEVAMQNGGWSSVTLGTPVAVTAAQSVFVAFQYSATALFYEVTHEADGYYESNDYADFPVATLSEWAGEGTSYRVRVYVEAGGGVTISLLFKPNIYSHILVR
jgi:hypothetical protein